MDTIEYSVVDFLTSVPTPGTDGGRRSRLYAGKEQISRIFRHREDPLTLVVIRGSATNHYSWLNVARAKLLPAAPALAKTK